MKQNISPYVSLIAIVAIALIFASPALASVTVDEHGNVIVTRGQVLSSKSSNDDDDSEDNSGSSEDDSDDNSGSSNDDDNEDNSGSSNDDDDSEDNSGSGSGNETETVNADGSITKTKTEDNGEVRTETRLPDGTKVKTRVKEDRTRTDVYQNGTKVRLERRDDRFRITVEDEQGEETELDENEIISIDERVDRNQIRIRTFASPADQLRHRAIIERLNTQALTDLPLSVNTETNELTVTTPAGEKTVTVLPDQAVQNMLAANVIDRIGGQALVNLVQEGGIDTLNQVIELSEQNGVPVYQIQGIKEHRLLGFFPLTTDFTVTVSAETGEVVDSDKTIFDSIIDILSTS